MTENGKQPLVEIERLLKRYRATFAEAADTIRNENVSNYPIFVLSKTEIEVGVRLLTQGMLPDDWIVMASCLEEFHVRKLIMTDKIEDFRTLYRRHAADICVFVFTQEGVANFVFIPA